MCVYIYTQISVVKIYATLHSIDLHCRYLTVCRGDNNKSDNYGDVDDGN